MPQDTFRNFSWILHGSLAGAMGADGTAASDLL